MQKTKNKKMKTYSSYSEITTLNLLVYVTPDISLTKLCLKLQEFYSSLFDQKENMPGLRTNGNCIDWVSLRIESQLLQFIMYVTLGPIPSSLKSHFLENL